MIKHLFLIWGLLAALTAEPVLACTSAVVSGKVTPDGRPLLWKNRDTDYLRNHVAYIKGEKYNFIADVNSANFPCSNIKYIDNQLVTVSKVQMICKCK